MPLLALVLAAITARTELINETVQVPRSQWRALTVDLRERPATVEVDFQVVSGRSGVRVVLMTAQDAERFANGRRHEVLKQTDYAKGGKFRYLVGNPGEYRILLDNRLEGREPAQMKVRVSLAYHQYLSFAPKQLSIGKRRAVAAASIGGFCVAALLIVRRLLPTLTSRV